MIRWLATYFASINQGFEQKERLFIAFGWIPKATVQAAIGGIVLDEAVKMTAVDAGTKGKYIEYGNIVLTTAVIAIILTAPLGAILINTLGVKWLSHDGVEEANLVAVGPEIEMQQQE